MNAPFPRRRNRRPSLLRLGTTAFLLASAPLTMPSVFISIAHAQNAPIQVLVDGRPIPFSDAQPTQVNGRVLVPMRGVFEALGATVDYDAQTRTALAVRGTTRVQLPLNSVQAFVNGQPRTLDVPAQSRLGRTMVPLRFVLEALGVQVQWDAMRNTVVINTGGNTIPDVPPVDNTPNLTTFVGTVVEVNDANSISLRDESGRIRTYDLAPRARFYRQTTGQVTAGVTPRYGTPVELNALPLLTPGEEVRVRLNNLNQVQDITAQTSIISARVLSSTGNRIVLDDERNTTLTIGPNLRFVDARGRSVSAADLQPGQSVALFITPSQRRIFQVSAWRSDLNAADGTGYVDDGGYDPGNNNGGVNNGGNTTDAPTISLVQHNANRPLRAGQTVRVTVRGTAGQNGSFVVVDGANEIALNEDAARPGVYTGTYIVRNGDDVLNGYITATLRDSRGRETTLQSQEPITIDTRAPRITGTSPQNGAVINNQQPNIVVNVNDLGGSGLASAQVSINNQQLDDTQISISRNAVRFTPDNLRNGTNTVRVTVQDEAGNTASNSFSFTLGEGGDTGNAIQSISHNATRALVSGDRVTVSLRAAEGGRASFSVIGDNGRIVRNNIPMTEDRPGRYIGTYTVPNDVSDMEYIIRGRFVDVDGTISTADATSSVRLDGGFNGGTSTQDLTITSPQDGTAVSSPLTLRGTAAPNSTVEITARVEGVRYLVFEYRQEIGGAQQVQANNRGNWTSDPIDLPRPRNVSGLRYIITATQIDESGRRGQPVTITLNGRDF